METNSWNRSQEIKWKFDFISCEKSSVDKSPQILEKRSNLISRTLLRRKFFHSILIVSWTSFFLFISYLIGKRDDDICSSGLITLVYIDSALSCSFSSLFSWFNSKDCKVCLRTQSSVSQFIIKTICNLIYITQIAFVNCLSFMF